MSAAHDASLELGASAACVALGVARATLYRHRAQLAGRAPQRRPRPTPERALSPPERQEVLDTLHSERFVDKAPATVYASLLDEGQHLCSVRTMYRILASNGPVRERRNQRRHPCYPEPQLVAQAPNQVWTWDITKFAGAAKWTSYHLYVVLDLYSRYVVAWRLERTESSALAADLLEQAFVRQGVKPGQLVVHADRGTSMTSKTVAQLFTDLAVTPSHSRPRVSNDNPFSESHFKTMKYRPDFPGRFGSSQDGRGYCRRFFAWYNHEHHHSGIAHLTPFQVHHGQADAALDARHKVLLDAYRAHPERFVNGPPTRPSLPASVWINEPQALETAP